MTKSAPDEGSDYNAEIIKEFRASQGRVGGPWAGTTLILIHHIGARSGVERVMPLGCSSQGDGRYVIVASSGGSPTRPDWYYNLKANPRITVEVGAQTFTVLRTSWPPPPAPSCGRSWSRSIPLLANTRPGPRGSFRCSC
jgi:deazaflavin-dependent oxidoreductase (nitroreductase family)